MHHARFLRLKLRLCRKKKSKNVFNGDTNKQILNQKKWKLNEITSQARCLVKSRFKKKKHTPPYRSDRLAGSKFKDDYRRL